jgi:hypothetical protein
MSDGLILKVGAGLAADAKAWALPKFWRFFERELRRRRACEFASIPELHAAVADRSVANGDWVKLRCKALPFGPMLSSHFMPALIGMRFDLRLGPQVLSTEHPAMSVISQISSHWTPVGLYPPLGDGASQICLYPHDSMACGVTMAFHPGGRDIVPTIPAIVPNRLSDAYGIPGWLIAQLRRVDVDAFTAAGYTAEDYEVFRQRGAGWFLDAVHEDALFTTVEDGVVGEMWGGLYAAGHFELASAGLKIGDLKEVFRSAVSSVAEDVSVIDNQAGEREVYIFARGVRATFLRTLPLYSVHMDADVARNFGPSRDRFEALTSAILRGVHDACNAKSVELLNPNDLDFTYVDSAAAYTVLKSRAAERIPDPILVAIRDWHRQRNVARGG